MRACHARVYCHQVTEIWTYILIYKRKFRPLIDPLFVRRRRKSEAQARIHLDAAAGEQVVLENEAHGVRNLLGLT